MMQRQKPFIRTEHHPFKTCDDFNCAVCIKSIAKFRIKPKLNKEEFFGNAPAPFIGRFGYPNVNVGILSPPEVTEDAWLYDAPRYWAVNLFQIPQIVDYRASLINSHSRANIKSSDRILQISQEVGMAAKPVEIEMFLKRVPVLRMSTDTNAAPIGPSAEIKAVKITSNPKIPQKVEKVYSDKDLKAAEAMNYLYKSGFDENSLMRILSVGAVGLKTNRKLVPTRWSITATDDIIGKQIISKIKNYNNIDTYSLYFGGYLGNYFCIMLFPEVWSYELFEMLAGHYDYTTDYESYEGRKRYVEETAGGYYAARLPILEKLNEKRKQASVLALRFITNEYYIPLGVFVVREAVRKAMNSSSITFSSKEEMLGYARNIARQKFGMNIDFVYGGSKLLESIRSQKKLADFC